MHKPFIGRSWCVCPNNNQVIYQHIGWIIVHAQPTQQGNPLRLITGIKYIDAADVFVLDQLSPGIYPLSVFNTNIEEDNIGVGCKKVLQRFNKWYFY